MMKLISKLNHFPVLIGLCAGLGFLIYQALSPIHPTFIFTNNYWALKTASKQLLVSDPNKIPDAQYELFKFGFSKPESININNLKSQTLTHYDAQTSIISLGNQVWKISINDTNWLYFGPNFESFPTNIPVSSQTDYWILSSTASLPQNINLPTEAIMLLSNRAPKKALKDLATPSQTPILNLKHKYWLKFRHSETGWEAQSASSESKN